MESTHSVKYYVNPTVAAYEQDLIDLAKDLGVDMPQHILRIFVQLLEEGFHPSSISKLCRDLSRNSSIDKKPSSS